MNELYCIHIYNRLKRILDPKKYSHIARFFNIEHIFDQKYAMFELNFVKNGDFYDVILTLKTGYSHEKFRNLVRGKGTKNPEILKLLGKGFYSFAKNSRLTYSREKNEKNFENLEEKIWGNEENLGEKSENICGLLSDKKINSENSENICGLLSAKKIDLVNNFEHASVDYEEIMAKLMKKR